jgi:hypothetical protein
MKQGDRVRFTDKPFLSDGFIEKITTSFSGDIYIIRLDEKAPNEYAWETDQVLSFGNDIEVIE